jgi:hypothetical protein
MAVQPTLSGIFIDWTTLKAIINANSLMIQYAEDSKKYNIWTFNGPSLLRTTIYKAGISVGGLDQQQNDTDRSDFETNYKADANGLDRTAIRIEDDVDVDVNVDAVNSGNILNNKFCYCTFTENQSISNSSFTTIYTYSGTGIIYGAFLELNWEDMDIELIVDGEKVMDGMKTVNLPVCGSGNSGYGPLAPFCGRLSSKDIVIQPPAGIRYTSSVTIKLKSSSNGKKLISGYIALSKES